MFHEDFRVEIFGDGEDGKKRLIGVVEAVNSSNETIPRPIGCAVSQKPVALASSDRLKRLEMAIETLVPS